MTNPQIKEQLKKAQRLFVAGKMPEALALYQAIRKAQPDSLEAVYGVALIQLKKGEIGKALVKMRAVAQARPNHASIRANYALALAAARKNKPAKQELLAAAALNQKHPATLLQLARALSGIGAMHEATVTLPPFDADLKFALKLQCIDVALAANDRGLASQWLSLTCKAGGGEAADWRVLAQYGEKLNEYDLALGAFEKFRAAQALAADDYVFGLALLLQARKTEEARSLADEALAQPGKLSPAFLTLVARLDILENDIEGALGRLEQAIKMDPGHGQAWLFLAQHCAAETLPKAKRDCEAALEKANPVARVSMLYALGDMARRTDNRDVAFDWFHRANQLQHAVNAEAGFTYVPARYDKVRGNLYDMLSGLPLMSADGKDHDSPVFIVGMPRSGTSLLERMVSALTGAAMNGENHALAQVCERYYSDHIVGDAPAPSDLAEEDLRGLANAYWKASQHQQNLASDKMPTNYRHIGMALAMFPQAKVIHMRRDPMDTLWSMYRREFPPSYAYATDFDSLAHAYADCEAFMSQWKKQAADRILTVDYEALVQNPEAETRRIADYIGVAWTADCLESHEVTDSSFTFSEMQVREPVHTDYVARWKAYEAFLGPLQGALDRRNSEAGE